MWIVWKRLLICWYSCIFIVNKIVGKIYRKMSIDQDICIQNNKDQRVLHSWNNKEAGTKDKKHHFLPGENGVFRAPGMYMNYRV